MESWARALDSPEAESSMIIRDDDGKLYTKVYQGPAINWNYDVPTSWVWRFPQNALQMINRIEWGQAIALNLLSCPGARSEYLSDGMRVVAVTEWEWKTNPCVNASYGELYRAQFNNDPWPDAEPYLADIDDTITTWLFLDANGRPMRGEVRAGTTRYGMLIEAWEMVDDRHVPADQVPADVFDPAPPETLFSWDSGNPAGVMVRPEPQTIAISEALDLAPSALFAFPPEAPAQLTSIEATALTGEQPNWVSDQSQALDTAMRRGLALRFTYTITTTEGVLLPMRLYQGPADRLREYLRAAVRWTESEPTQVTIAGRTIDGWRVRFPENSTPFILVEVDGTLIALEAAMAEKEAALALMQRLNQP